jgi:hypothetical protein
MSSRPTINRDTLLEDLRENVIDVIFTKVNGEERRMKCTLMPSILPAKYITEEAAERNFHETNKETIRAWDIENNGWRSFRIENVSFVQALDYMQYV